MPVPAVPKIDRFRGHYEFLSNFSPAPVILDGEIYPTVEHAFQAAKSRDTYDRLRIRTAKTAAEAKKLGRKVFLREDWDRVKLDTMLDLLRQKFASGALRRMLAATGDAELEEGNWWGDTFWGTSRGHGENWLGVLLMHVRREVQEDRKIPVAFLNQRERAW